MKVLFVTGTTCFPTLFRFAVEASKNCEHSIVYQSLLEPDCDRSNVVWVSFFQEKFFWRDFDLVITHCGAGTIFSLLGDSVNFVAVPNADRFDDHQFEIFDWLKENDYAFCCDLSQIHNFNDLLKNISTFNFVPYPSVGSFELSEILDFFKVHPNV